MHRIISQTVQPAVLRDDLIHLLGHNAVRSRVTDLVKYATDASPYRLFPQVVIVAENVDQVAKTIQYAKQNQPFGHVPGIRFESERSIAR